MTQDYQQLLTQAVLDRDDFVRLTMKGIVRGPAAPWQKIVIRPIELRGRRQLQFSYFDAKQDVSKNYYGPEARARLAEALDIPYSSIVLQTTGEDVQIQLTRKGKPIIHRHRHAGPAAAPAPDLAHNHAKALPIPADQPDSLLQAIGIMNEHGQIRPNMQGKFAQINEFLKLIEATGELERFERSPIEVLDCGCGSSYLTFAIYHYLNDLRGIAARIVGVDTNAKLIDKCAAQATQLEYGELCFQNTPIIAFQPERPPDLVIALHACDTATDEAIAQAIRAEAHMLVCAPCCHHDLNEQLSLDRGGVFRPVLRHGILKQRMADILTDAFRALALRIMGYRTDVIEFVASEHTAKNLMIRAVKTTSPGDRQFVREYNELKQFWGVTPYIEGLLGEPFLTLLAG
ncbi:MAG TPA: SAM-dependent methyltransferase [Roseiflexaceae bacterium]|nr:SAM-dependent methyltransferase [Roseiflexaceae bacterium]